VSDEYALRKSMEAGARAKTVLESPAYSDAYKAVREAIIEQWEQCPIRDREGAHELKLMLKLHTDIHRHMERAVEDGKFAAEQLKQDKSFGEKLRDRLRIA
jgi:hypothetical protein